MPMYDYSVGKVTLSLGCQHPMEIQLKLGVFYTPDHIAVIIPI